MTLRSYSPYVGPEPLGEVWTLHRGPIELRCVVFTHPKGWELKLFGYEQFWRGQVCATPEAVSVTAGQWRQQAERQGWR